VPHHKSLLAQAKNNLGLALLGGRERTGADAELRDSLAIKQLLADGFPKKGGVPPRPGVGPGSTTRS